MCLICCSKIKQLKLLFAVFDQDGRALLASAVSQLMIAATGSGSVDADELRGALRMLNCESHTEKLLQLQALQPLLILRQPHFC